MFLLRSAFWLTAAYLVMAPAHAERIDLQGAGRDLADRAVRAGQQALAQQLEDPACRTLHCQGGRAALSALVREPVVSPMQEPQAVPYPMPRPSWRGS
jgi:hypothetical protein